MVPRKKINIHTSIRLALSLLSAGARSSSLVLRRVRLRSYTLVNCTRAMMARTTTSIISSFISLTRYLVLLGLISNVVVFTFIEVRVIDRDQPRFGQRLHDNKNE